MPLPFALASLLAACLAAGVFKALAADFVIDTPVTITNGGNILNGNDTLTVNASGSITTSGNGINATAGDTIINNGSINTSGRSSEGIFAGDRNTITNNGSITTSGDDGEGIQVFNQNTITNNGSITTSGNVSEGIYAQAGTRNNIITNSGSITTSGNFSEGIDAETGNTITNDESITTSGDFSEGIDVETGNSVINSGTITTSGNSSEGIDGFRDNPLLANDGIIRTEGELSHGIRARTNNTVRNSQTITTRGRRAYGIKAGDEEDLNAGLRNNNRVSNTGAITTRGAEAAGVWMTNGNILTHSGMIRTFGPNAPGIQAANDNTLTLNGGITTAGSGSHGILTGTGTTLNLIGPNSRIKTMAADADGLRVGGLAASQTTLTHRGHIEAGGAGIRLPYVQNFENSGTIKGANGAGVTFTGMASGPVTVTNTGTIQGGTYGLDYGTNTIERLTNISPRSLRGGSRAALRAGALLNLDNRGAIISEQASAIQLTGTASQAATIANRGTIRGAALGLDYGMNAISMLTNSSMIQGGSGPALQAGAIGTLNNTGTIRSTGGTAIEATGLNKLTNSGTIEGQTAIRLTRTGMGSNTMIDNAGTLRSLQGTAGTALDLIGKGQDTLRLRAGSTLEGQIRWDGEEGDLLQLDSLGPTRLTFIDNDAPANTQPTRFKVKAPTGLLVFRSATPSNTVGEARTILTLLDPAHTDPRTDATQSLWTGAVFQSLAQQQAQMTHKDSARHRSGHDVMHSALWVRPFGGLQNYKREDETPAARYRYGGALVGYGMVTSEWQAGAFLGAARSELRRRGQGAEAEGREVFLGAYGQTRWQALKVSVAVLFGKSRNETEWLWGDNRVSGGLERREYAGKHNFISPELGLSTQLDMGGVALIPELKLRYLGLFDAESRERTGQADGLVFKPEDRHIGLIRASVGFPLSFPANQYGGQLSGQLRVGAEGRKRLGGDRIAVRSGNDTVRYRAGGDDAVMGFVGAGFEYGVSALNLSFSADVEAGYDSEAALGVRGQLGFVWGF